MATMQVSLPDPVYSWLVRVAEASGGAISGTSVARQVLVAIHESKKLRALVGIPEL